jgi:8-oxo-dGTP diphosphatase
MARVVAAGAVVRDGHGRCLLVLRSKAPEAGRWSIPGGTVEPGETLAEAAEREVREETGLVVRATRELGCVELPAVAHGDVFEIHDFSADWISGRLAAGDDAADARWFAVEELPLLPLTTDLLAYLTGYGVYP